MMFQFKFRPITAGVFLILVFSLQILALGVFAATKTPLIANVPIKLPGSAGHFDFMEVDPSARRILAAHTGTSTLELLDLNSGKPMTSLPVGDAQGVAIDSRDHRYFLGNDKKQNIVTIDSSSLKQISETKVDGPVDAITFDSKRGMVFAAKDDGNYLWVIDPAAAKVLAKVSIPGVPEVLVYDSKTDRIYLNIKDKDLVVKINPETRAIEALWPTAPASSPHGLAIDSLRGRIYAAGGNGQLVTIDMKTGKILSSVEIPTGVDQIAFDSETRTIFSACRGFIGVSEDTDKGLKTLGRAPSAKGSHNLAIDPNSHDVWVSYSDLKHSYFQKFELQQ
jgi:DNA-binding beta-propeller fold protein YncE